MHQPWLAHYFPGLTIEQLVRGNWTLGGIVAMHDFAKSSSEH